MNPAATEGGPLETKEHVSENGPGAKIPGYEILGELGRGGMGIVYKARQGSLDRIVALKTILFLDSAEQVARFQLEAKAAARLQHPNVVQIFEVGAVDGRPFFSMEFIEGGSLATLTNGLPQPLEEAARTIETLARAVQVAHENKIIHRDLKPANILFKTDGALKIADFGLAKDLDRHTLATKGGIVLGTPRYMAPEQAAGRTHDVGPACDIYAMGAILYELLTGRPPFLGATTLETLGLVVNTEPVLPRRLRPEIPPDLEAICLTCLEKKPARRYPSATALADDLTNWSAKKSLSPHARLRPMNDQSAIPWRGLAGLLLLGNLASLALALFLWTDKPKREDNNRIPVSSKPEDKKPDADDDLKLPAISPEGAAARVRADLREVEKRCKAVRELGDVDCNRWPEATEALVRSLRFDPQEPVRFEAAIALGKGNCGNEKTIKALEICIKGSGIDGAPPEMSARVKDAALKALKRYPIIPIEIEPKGEIRKT